VRVEQGENDVFVVVGEEYREPVREELVAPGVRVGFGPEGETVMVEIFGDEAAQSGR
jgi:hypothetical protein